MPLSSQRRGLSPGRLARRWLYLTHRWIGIVSCLLFVMWFVSGLVMVYVPYPSLSPAEKLARAQAIDWRAVDVPPPVAMAMPKRLLLEMRDGVPVWRIEDWDGSRTTLPASGSTILRPVDKDFAVRIARQFSGKPAKQAKWIERDQWTVAGGFDRHRPLWKVDLDDAAGTALYVSSSTGEVVQKTTRGARFWNWMGSVPHWIYPTILRKDGPAWRQVVLWVSGPCIAGALTGLWIGVMRARLGRRRFKGGRITPYHGWMLWHHAAGMAGGLFLITWIFSGWLSVDPGRLFGRREIEDALVRHYESIQVPTLDLARTASVGGGARRVELTGNAGRPLLIFYHADGTRILRDAATLAPTSTPQAAIVAAARALVPDGHLIAADRLTAPDAYWYEVGSLPRLPMLRLRFDDPARTWLQFDPATGELIDVLDRRRRLYRWLFDLLHKWDLNILTQRRPAWDLLLWILSALGLITSISGIILACRRLAHKPGLRAEVQDIAGGRAS